MQYVFRTVVFGSAEQNTAEQTLRRFGTRRVSQYLLCESECLFGIAKSELSRGQINPVGQEVWIDCVAGLERFRGIHKFVLSKIIQSRDIIYIRMIFQSRIL